MGITQITDTTIMFSAMLRVVENAGKRGLKKSQVYDLVDLCWEALGAGKPHEHSDGSDIRELLVFLHERNPELLAELKASFPESDESEREQ